MPNFPWPLKVALFFINIGGPDTSKPLVHNRKKTDGWMRFMDSACGIRTKNFHSITKHTFTSSEGHEIKMRVFTPSHTNEKLPIVVYYHGGGFAYGHYMVRPNFLKAVAAQVNCIVVSVEYRLSPENPFPAGLHDCYEALQWVEANADKIGGDAKRIAVCGESAGGNLSAAVSMMARDKRGPKIIHQTLLYPAVDMTMNYPSMKSNSKGYMLTEVMIEQFGAAYLGHEGNLSNVYAAPILGKHEDLPPATIITAQYDPLVDQGNLYAEKLMASGVPVVHKEYENAIHDFTLMMGRTTEQSRHSTQLVVNELKKAFKK